MRRARATSKTALAFLLALLATLSFARPAMADDPSDPSIASTDADGSDVGDVGTIDATQPHLGGYVSSGTRLSAKPGSLGAGAYDQLPASVDLRQYAPPVGDQGSIGACVAWTISHSIMGYYAIRTGGVDSPYAPLYLYLKTVAAGGAPNSGLNPDAAMANAKSYGVDSQDDFFQGTTNYKVAPTAAQNANAANYRITGWTRLWSGNKQGTNAQTVIEQALANGMPVAVGFPVFNDFMNLGSHTLYTTTSGTSLGGHMVTAFGYDADGVYLRNQWGTDWGNNGDAHVSWAFVEQVMTGAYVINGITTPSTAASIAPLVTGLSVTQGTAGTSVAITGSGLLKATGVSFGGSNASFTKSTVNGVTKLTATAPAHVAGTVDVAVTNPAGTSANTAADNYTYPAPLPVLSAISPTTGSSSGGATVKLTGTAFTGATAVKVGGSSADFTVNSDTAVTVTMPAHSLGTVSVTVTTTGGTTYGKNFTYVSADVPTVTSLSPSSGASTATTTVTVTGTNLTNVTKVSLGDTALSWTLVNATTLRIFVKARAAGSATLTITTSAGTSNGVTFSAVTPAKPVISLLTPATGLTTAATAVTVSGSGFTGATRLSLGGRAMSFQVVSATSITFSAPKHAAQGLPVIIVGPGGTSAAKTFTYKSSLVPVLNSLSVGSASGKRSTVTVITGRFLTGAYYVTSAAKKVAMKRISDTQLQVTLPLHAAGAVAIKAVTAGGTSNALTFTYS
jgi:hypothetical protein